jgi:hypothetical protein
MLVPGRCVKIGRVTRVALESCACECYRTIKGQYGDLASCTPKEEALWA